MWARVKTMKMFRELTRVQFVKRKIAVSLFLMVMFAYYLLFAKGLLSEGLSFLGFLVALLVWIMFKSHEVCDGKYKDSEEQKIMGEKC